MRLINLALGVILVGLLTVTAALAWFWTPFPVTAIVADRLQPPGWPHLLGTDGFGSDIFSRLMSGAGTVLMMGVAAVVAAALVGTAIGVVAGMRPGWLGVVLQRGADILYGFPALLLAILFAAAVGGSQWTAAAAISLATIPAFVRVARAATLQVMSETYVEAARLVGATGFQVARRHVLPNIAPVLGVQASVSFGIAILAEAGLSYLGLGSGPEAPTWGRMLREGQDLLFNAPLVALWPGLAITFATLGFNLLGDGLREWLDPTLREIA